MTNDKCKNSVFCILFLVFFSLGTICGSLLISILMRSDLRWLQNYCQALRLSSVHDISTWCLFFARPLLIAYTLSCVSFGDRLVLPYIAIRGCFCSYLFAALYISDCPFTVVLLRELILMPLFYMLCRRTWLSRPNLCYMQRGADLIG